MLKSYVITINEYYDNTVIYYERCCGILSVSIITKTEQKL